MCIHVCSVLQMSAKKLTLFCIKRIVTMYNSILKNVLVDVRVLTGDGPPCIQVIHSVQCTCLESVNTMASVRQYSFKVAVLALMCQLLKTFCKTGFAW